MKPMLFYAVHAVLLAAGYYLVAGRTREPWPRSRLTGLLLGCALASCTFVISEPQGAIWQDFIDAYHAGGRAALQGRQEVVALLTQGVHGFVNLPVVAYLFAPLGWLPPRRAALVFTVLGLLASFWAFHACAQAARLPARQTRLLAVLFALNGPLFNSLREGNTTHFALLAVAVAMLQLRANKELAAGAWIAAAAIFKLPLLIFGGYFLVSGRLRAALTGGLLLLGVAASSIFLFGWDVHVGWYGKFVAGAGDQPIAAFNVQSVPALVARLERGGSSLADWSGHPLSPVGRAIAKALTGAIALFALFVCARDARARIQATRKRDSSQHAPASSAPARPSALEQARELEYLIVLVLACVMSPLAWSHYFALLLLPMAFLLSPEFPAARTRAHRLLVVLSIVLLSLPVVWPPHALTGEGVLADLGRLGLSHFVFGELILLALLLRARANVELDAAPRTQDTDSSTSSHPDALTESA